MHYTVIAKICDKEALSLEDALQHDHWVAAMKSELEFILKNNTWKYMICSNEEKIQHQLGLQSQADSGW